MSEKMDNLFLELERVAQRLNSACDKINQKIESYERKLAEIGLGMSAEISVGGKDVRTLLYAKGEQGWGFYVAEATFPRSFKRLRDSSREIRLKALLLVPQLLEKMLQKATDMLEGRNDEGTGCDNFDQRADVAGLRKGVGIPKRPGTRQGRE